MIRNIIIAALAGTAAIATPSLAKPGATGQANVNTGAHVNTSTGMNAGMNARVNSQGSLNASPNARIHSDVNTSTTVNPNAGVNARVNSQGAANASVKGLAHANANSAVARGSVQASALPGLTTGLMVKDSAGASIGTVNQVVLGTDGSVRAVIVTKTDGSTIRLMPNTLTISGDVVTSTTVTGG